MAAGTDRRIDLDSLSTQIPAITPAAVGFYRENCMVCFDAQGHSSGVDMSVEFNGPSQTFSICWSGEVDDQVRRAYADDKDATNHAAVAIALLLTRELTSYTAVEQSTIGTGFDYWLADRRQSDNTLIFNHAARLEISGIRRETPDNSVQGRIEEKRRRFKPGSHLPTFIAVVEFSRPWSRMVKL